MNGLETAADWAALTMDAEKVADSLKTLMWYLRGHVTAASDAKGREIAERTLSVAEGALGKQQVVFALVSNERDRAVAREDEARKREAAR